jgi:hypothetical protein
VINQSPLLLKFHKRWGIARDSVVAYQSTHGKGGDDREEHCRVPMGHQVPRNDLCGLVIGGSSTFLTPHAC